MKKLLLLFAVLLTALHATAYDFEVDGIYYDVLSMTDLTCEVTHNGKIDFWGYPDGSSYSGNVTIPSSVTYTGRTFSVIAIEAYAFLSCSGLTEITSLNTTPPSVQSETFNGVSKTTCIVNVPIEALEAYQAADVWNLFWNLQGIDVTAINEVKNGERNGGKTYTIDGREARKGQRGLVIENGRKILR